MIIIEYKGFPLSPVEKMAEESVEEQLSELEERVWKEKKRMREMVSSLMGQYLLKGHRMLNSSCGECGNILLRTQEGAIYCIYCTEVAEQAPEHGGSGSTSSSDNVPSTASKKTPTSNSGSEHQVPTACTGRTSDTFKLTTSPADHDTMTTCTTTNSKRSRTNPAITRTRTTSNSTADTPAAASNPTTEIASNSQPKPTAAATDAHSEYAEARVQCQAELVSKLQWCTGELEKTHSVEYTTQLCKLITAAAEALKSLQEHSGAA